MNVKYATNAQQWGQGYTLIQQATRRLEEILGPSAALVSVEWECVVDKTGRSLYRLTLQDVTGPVSTEFAPEELMNPMHMHVRLYRLWGDLLQKQSDEQHKLVQTITGQINGGQEGD
jgi:hypothetical protein